jgi:hypothetical protein
MGWLRDRAEAALEKFDQWIARPAGDWQSNAEREQELRDYGAYVAHGNTWQWIGAKQPPEDPEYTRVQDTLHVEEPSDRIKTLTIGEWQNDGIGQEAREHIGVSERGYHYALEVSRGGGDSGDLNWSAPVDTLEDAMAGGALALDKWDDARGEVYQEWETQQIASHDPQADMKVLEGSQWMNNGMGTEAQSYVGEDKTGYYHSLFRSPADEFREALWYGPYDTLEEAKDMGQKQVEQWDQGSAATYQAYGQGHTTEPQKPVIEALQAIQQQRAASPGNEQPSQSMER